jgi:dolichol-phosphate mannosyltransferase
VWLLPTLGGGVLIVVAVVVGLAGIQMLALGILGEYLWRALEEARRRPQYVIERVAGRHPAVFPPRTAESSSLR